jgi:O-antigen ligase
MEMVIPLFLGHIFATRRARSGRVLHWRHRLLSWATPEASRSLLTFFCGLIMVAALLLTGSRSGLLSFLGSMVLVALLLSVRRMRTRNWWAVFSLFVALGFGYALWLNPGKILEPFAILWLGAGHPAARGRLFLWHDVWRLGWDYRWSGTGLNTFSWAFPLYKRPGVFEHLYTHAENDYLQAFAEGGLLLVGILALAIIWGGARLLAGWTELQQPDDRGLGIGLLAGLAALLLHSAGDFNLHIMANAILFVLLLALANRVLIFGYSREPLP